MAATKSWTLDELHRLPEDGNTYELVHGELFVTPAPGPDHETIAIRLARVLEPYVVRHDLGYVARPRAVIQHEGSQVEPDLAVRKLPGSGTPWTEWPVPILVVEILSPATQRRDRELKRAFYSEVGVSEYWIVDPTARTITAVRTGQRDGVAHDVIVWEPPGVTTPLAIELAGLFE